MPYKNEFWGRKRIWRLFQKLPFYNVLIEKPRVKRVKNIDLLPGLTFYDELSIAEISQAFRTYARSYEVEIRDSKKPFAAIRS